MRSTVVLTRIVFTAVIITTLSVERTSVASERAHNGITGKATSTKQLLPIDQSKEKRPSLARTVRRTVTHRMRGPRRMAPRAVTRRVEDPAWLLVPRRNKTKPIRKRVKSVPFRIRSSHESAVRDHGSRKSSFAGSRWIPEPLPPTRTPLG